MSSWPIELLYLAFPLSCILAIPPASRPGSGAERLVFGIALYQLLLLAIGLLLGLTHHLLTPWFTAAIGGATALLAVRGWRHGLALPLPAARRLLRTRRGAALSLALLLAVLVGTLEVGFDFLLGTRHGDGLWYHIPRVIFWLQQGSFAPWETPVAASLGLPVGADLVLLHKLLLGRGWGGGGYVTCMLAAGAVACVYLAGLEFGLKRWHAAMAALLFAGFPAVGLRIWSVNSDLAAAFPALAGCVALHRVRSPRLGLAAFLLLNAVAIACKPTVAPPALALAGVTLWQVRRQLPPLREVALPCAVALVLGTALVVASYWPVYAAFGDFLGGGYSRAHRTATAAGFLHAAAMHTAYWLLEPLGYLTRFRETWESEALRVVYNVLGAGFTALPETWKPYPGQDTGTTGLIPLLALPLLLAGLSARVRGGAALIFLLGYLPLSGMIAAQPYFPRYNVLLLAGVALLWGGTGWFAKGRRRWLLAAVTIVNLCALAGIVAINIYLHATKWSQTGGAYYYLSDQDRSRVAASLAGRPLLVLTESSTEVSSLDALLTGPRVAFPLRYVICPADGDWPGEFRKLAGVSNWLAMLYPRRASLIAGPEFERPGHHACAAVPAAQLEEALLRAGWTRYRDDPLVNLWRHF